MRDAVSQAVKESMKARDAARTGTLRMINAAIKDRDILARGQGAAAASDEELVATLSKMIRQREESAKLYDEGGRPELASKERDEIEVIRGFLPKQMSEEEVRAAARAAIAEAGAASARDMGKVMALLKSRHAGEYGFRQGERRREGTARLGPSRPPPVRGAGQSLIHFIRPALRSALVITACGSKRSLRGRLGASGRGSKFEERRSAPAATSSRLLLRASLATCDACTIPGSSSPQNAAI